MLQGLTRDLLRRKRRQIATFLLLQARRAEAHISLILEAFFDAQRRVGSLAGRQVFLCPLLEAFFECQGNYMLVQIGVFLQLFLPKHVSFSLHDAGKICTISVRGVNCYRVRQLETPCISQLFLLLSNKIMAVVELR